MLPSYLLSLREGIEAALIVGIVLGALRQMRRTDLSSAVWIGVLSASMLSVLAGVLLTVLGLSFEGRSEQLFEGVAMLLAAGVLTWMIFWMSRQARNIKGELESGVHKAAFEGGRRGLFALAFLAVLREGIELALFLVASVFASDVQQTLIGAFLGWNGHFIGLVAFCNHRAPRPAPFLPGDRFSAHPVRAAWLRMACTSSMKPV